MFFNELMSDIYQKYIKVQGLKEILEYSQFLQEVGYKEKSLLLLENHREKHINNISYIKSLTDLYFDYYLFDKVFDILVNPSIEYIENDIFELICRKYINETLFYYNFKKINKVVDIIQDKNFKKEIDKKYKEYLSVREDIERLEDKEFFLFINELYRNKENKAAARYLFVKYEMGDRSFEIFHHLAGNIRLELPANFSFFREKGYDLYPDSAERLYGYVSFLFKQYRWYETRKYLDYKLRYFLLRKDQSISWKKNLYYLYIRLSNLLGIYPKPTLLTREESVLTKLYQPWMLEDTHNTNLKNYQKSISLKKRQPKDIIYTALVLSGQIRGELKTDFLDQLSLIANKKYLFTWSKAAVSRIRFSRLDQIFSSKAISLLPKDFQSKELFSKIFPKTILKIENDISNFTLCSKAIIKDLDFDYIEYKNEDDFNKRYGSNNELLVSGKLNQAKMYYLNYISLVQSRSYYKDIDVIIKIRPDLTFDLDMEFLWKCVELCNQNKNLILIPYVLSNGYGDQFAIGHKLAMQKYGEAWRNCLIKNKLRYSHCFENFADNGAEQLLANHLLLQGLEVRYISLKNRKLSAPILPTNISEYLSIFEKEFYSIEEEQQQQLNAFFNYIRTN